jgi:GNAT superfamily N-acetyltransferase
MIFSDKTLSQKLERTEASSNAGFVEVRAALYPDDSAEWIEISGAYAMFDGVESPLTQTFGLGMFEDATAEQLDQLEAFFKNHDAPVFHEVSPMADPSLLELLSERGYRPMELTSVMFQPVSECGESAINPEISCRIIGDGEEEMWARTSADGWATAMPPEMADFMYELAKIGTQVKSAYSFLAELDGRPIAAGGLFISNDVALLAGASTIPDGRKQGAQSALLDARLRFAKEQDCTLAMMCAAPGSQSQRNAEKNGFRIAYTRTKWMLTQA